MTAIDELCDMLSNPTILNCEEQEYEIVLKNYRLITSYHTLSENNGLLNIHFTPIIQLLQTIEQKHREYIYKLTYINDEQQYYCDKLKIPIDYFNIRHSIKFLYIFYTEFVQYIQKLSQN